MSAASSPTTTAAPLSEWSGKLPPWGSISGGGVFEQVTPDSLTAARGSSRLLPTPTVWVQGEVDLDKYLARRAREKAKGRNGNGFGMPLDMAVRLLPTPTTMEAHGGRSTEDLLAGNTRDKRGHTNLKLREAVRLLPTPHDGATTPPPSAAGS